MTAFLAAYDPHCRDSFIPYWAWWHRSLYEKLLNDFYYRIATQHLPSDPATLNSERFHGGWASVSQEWHCVYRFYNGGRDTHGRPGRFVIVVGFYRHTDPRLLNPETILQGSVFDEFARLSPIPTPVPAPSSLEFATVPAKFLTEGSPVMALDGEIVSGGVIGAAMTAAAARGECSGDFHFAITKEKLGKFVVAAIPPRVSPSLILENPWNRGRRDAPLAKTKNEESWTSQGWKLRLHFVSWLFLWNRPKSLPFKLGYIAGVVLLLLLGLIYKRGYFPERSDKLHPTSAPSGAETRPATQVALTSN